MNEKQLTEEERRAIYAAVVEALEREIQRQNQREEKPAQYDGQQ